MNLIDKYNRVHNYLRISITDNCNLNCVYCNPNNSCDQEKNKSENLSHEEIEKIISIFLKLGFEKIKLTGGEPFARNDLRLLIKNIKKQKSDKPFELSITTNGTLLNGHLKEFKTFGLDRINFSLDSLNKETFKRITGKDNLDKVLNSIKSSIEAGFKNIKINTVILKDINDNEVLDFCEFAINNNINVRFIEFMPFSNNEWDSKYYISSEDIKKLIEENYVLLKIADNDKIARNYSIHGQNGKISFISPISDHFCESCNRLRITSEGNLQLCLFSTDNNILDLNELIRSNQFTDEEIIEKILHFIDRKRFEHEPLDELIKLKNNNMLKIGG